MSDTKLKVTNQWSWKQFVIGACATIAIIFVVFGIVSTVTEYYAKKKAEAIFQRYGFEYSIGSIDFKPSKVGVVFEDITIKLPKNSTEKIHVDTVYIDKYEDININGVQVSGDLDKFITFGKSLEKKSGSKTPSANNKSHDIIVTNIFANLTYKNHKIRIKNAKDNFFYDIHLFDADVIEIDNYVLKKVSYITHLEAITVEDFSVIYPGTISTNDTVTIPKHIDLTTPFKIFGKDFIHINLSVNKFAYGSVYGEGAHLITAGEVGSNTTLVFRADFIRYNDITLNKFYVNFGRIKDDRFPPGLALGMSFEPIITNKKLANDPVKFDRVDVNVWVKDPDPVIKFSGLVLINKLAFELSANVHSETNKIEKFHFGIFGNAKCQDLINAIPVQFKTLIADNKPKGYFDFDLNGNDLETASFHINNECYFENQADSELFKFRTLFTTDNGTFGAGTSSWTPLNLISHYMEKSVTFNEDAGFWNHHGFSNISIMDSIRQNIKAEAFVRGGSTITMQLAKNLFLKKDKQVARKIEEVLLTSHLEHYLTKGEIMELYLNIVEFGPGIFGINNAAKHYFNTTPMNLTLRQSMFLGMILPNPKATYMVNGAATPATREKITRLLRLMRDRGYILDEDIEDGKDEAWCACG